MPKPNIKPMPDGMQPVAPREAEGSDTRPVRKWKPIPDDKPDCPQKTETKYHQQWPFNSYIDERKEALQSLFAQLAPPASIVEDVMNDNYIQAAVDSGLVPIINIDPATAAIAKTIFNIGKGLGWWGKKKNDNSDKYNGRKPAGCASIAFLQLLYYYRNIDEICKDFPTLKNLSTDYIYKSDLKKFQKLDKSTSTYKDLMINDVEDVYAVMKKIGEAIPVTVYTEAGTAVLPTFMKKAAYNLGFTEFKAPLSNPNDEDAAKYMYQALCNDIIPLVYIGDIHTEKNKTDEGIEISYTGENCFHYFLVDGCKFDKATFAKTGKYADACKFFINDGWHCKNSHDGTSSSRHLVGEIAPLIAEYESAKFSKIFFFAPYYK